MNISWSKGERQPITALLPGPKEASSQSRGVLRTCRDMTAWGVTVSHGEDMAVLFRCAAGPKVTGLP